MKPYISGEYLIGLVKGSIVTDADRLGIDSGDVEILRVAVLMHDIIYLTDATNGITQLKLNNDEELVMFADFDELMKLLQSTYIFFNSNKN